MGALWSTHVDATNALNLDTRFPDTVVNMTRELLFKLRWKRLELEHKKVSQWNVDHEKKMEFLQLNLNKLIAGLANAFRKKDIDFAILGVPYRSMQNGS